MKSFESFREEMALEVEEYTPEKMANRERASKEYRKKVGLDKKVILPKSLPEEFEELEESSLSRIVDKVKKGGMATVSAERGDKSKKENKARSKALEKDIRGRGMGMTKATGKFVETDSDGKRKEVDERSYVVTPGKKGKRKFKKEVSKLGKKYDQDSVLIKQKPGLDKKASWLGTTDRKDAWTKKGKKTDQGKMSTKDANKPLTPGEGGTKIGKKTYQFK